MQNNNSTLIVEVALMTDKAYLGVSLTAALAATVAFHSIIGYVLQSV